MSNNSIFIYYWPLLCIITGFFGMIFFIIDLVHLSLLFIVRLSGMIFFTIGFICFSLIFFRFRIFISFSKVSFFHSPRTFPEDVLYVFTEDDFFIQQFFSKLNQAFFIFREYSQCLVVSAFHEFAYLFIMTLSICLYIKYLSLILLHPTATLYRLSYKALE